MWLEPQPFYSLTNVQIQNLTSALASLAFLAFTFPFAFNVPVFARQKSRYTMTSVRVGVRIRPLTSKEELEGGKPVVVGLHPTVGIGRRQFTYDAVFDAQVSQQNLYQQVAPPLLKSFLEGYNATVSARFA